jgi:hypothetical protein
MSALYWTNKLSFDFYSASSLKQQSAGKYVTNLDTLFWFCANLSLLLLLNAVCLAEKQQIPILWVFILTLPGLEPMIYCTRGEHATNANKQTYKVFTSY